MQSAHALVGALVIGSASLLQACGSGGGSGAGGTYASVASEELTLELKSGGTAVMSAAGLGASSGTYTVDGEKLIVTINNQSHTFIRDGNCIQDQLNVFGKMCKGGRAGEASNVSTRSVPTAPSGTWVATNADGEFKLEFKAGNRLALTATPAGGGAPDTREGTFTIEGDNIYATLSEGVPMVLKFVNNAYESTAFGLPMRFVKQ
jgi:hypothetical protein